MEGGRQQIDRATDGMIVAQLRLNFRDENLAQVVMSNDANSRPHNISCRIQDVQGSRAGK